VSRIERGRGISRRRFAASVGMAAGAAMVWSKGARGSADKPWGAGEVAHLIPAVNHDTILLKASFRAPQSESVSLRIDGRAYPGVPTDLERRYWTFLATGLPAGQRLQLQLVARRRPLCDPWPLQTLPHPDAPTSHFRLLSFTCAGGDASMRAPGGAESFRPIALRQRLLARAMAFAPQAVIANGDHVYWDQATWLQSRNTRVAELARAWYDDFGQFDRNLPLLGTANEALIRRIGEAQIASVYGTTLRSTPSYFVADDHDYFENDEAEERFVTFPPDHFSMSAKRAIQKMFYPEFLPDGMRPQGISGVLPDGLGASFGTLRVGRLFETLIYDCGGHLSLKGPAATLVPPEVEAWLLDRTRRSDTAQLLHVPSHPPGWSAGKWREWYPDVVESPSSRLTADGTQITDWGGPSDGQGRLTTAHPKHFWQSGWYAQHQRLMAALSAQQGRPAALLSGDLHATGALRMRASGDLDLSANPVHVVLAGTLGSSTAGWPSAARGAVPQIPASLTVDVGDPLAERNGFTLIDVTPERMVFRLFGWREPQPEADIDTLEPHTVIEVAR
jgi:hypothetical protein